MKNMSTKTKIVIASSVAVLVAVVFCLVAIAYNNNIYHGILVAGVDVGGMSQAEAREAFEKEEFFNDLPSFVCKDREFEIPPEDISLDCDAEKTSKQAQQYGKDTNPFVRIANTFRLFFSPVKLDLVSSYDEEAFSLKLDEYIKDLRTPSVEPQIRVEGDKLIIKNGSQGLDVNKEKLQSSLARVADGDNNKIELVIETVNPTPISARALYDEYAKGVVNADYTISNMRISYTESQDGIDFDIKEAEKIINDNVKNTDEYVIPLKITKPEITIETLDKSLFGDCLGTYTTRYNPGEVGRTKNVTLATRSINNIVLKTGEVFSYNNIVGERTEARGFSGAKVYAGGEVVDGLGGGICQVSSTLYNAVLYADLEVVSRTCHSLPVAYVPLGRDATVSYGSIDFRFKNQYDSPIKISATSGGGVLTVSVYGKKTTDKTVEIFTERISTLPFTEVEKVDDTIPEGTTKVKQTGSDGAVVKTYKKVIENGKVISSKMIHTSRYNPINKIILVPPVKEEIQDEPAEETVVAEPTEDTPVLDVVEPSSPIAEETVTEETKGEESKAEETVEDTSEQVE